MLKILLVSDLHLGLAQGELPVDGAVRIGTFKRIAALAREHDMLLVGGDLFDGENVESAILETVAHEFGRTVEKGVPVLFSPGEHETAAQGGLPGYLNYINAKRVFSDPEHCEPFLFEKEGQRLFIYGLPALHSSRLAVLSRAEEGGFHIGLFHAELNLTGEALESGALVLDKNRIRELGLDFFALGHHHHFKLFKHNRKVIGAYPGSPEATCFAEKGERYVLSLIIENNELVQIKRLTVNTLEVDDVSLDCAGIAGFEGLTEYLEGRRSDRMVLRLTLTGGRSFPVDYAMLMNFRKKFDRLIINDESEPDLDVLMEECRSDDSLRGDFFSVLKKEIDDGTLPGGIEKAGLSRILNRLMKKGSYVPEEWLC